MCLLIAVLVWAGRASVASGRVHGILILFIAQRLFSDIFSKYSLQYVAQYYSARHDREGYMETLLGTRYIQGLVGLSLIPMATLFSPYELVSWWLGLLALSALMVLWVSERLSYAEAQPDTLPEYGADDEQFVSAGNIRSMLSRGLIRWLTLTAFAISILTSLLLFSTLSTVGEHRTEFLDVIRFFGLVTGIGIWLIIPLKYLILTRLLRQMNAGQLTEIYPIILNIALVILEIIPSIVTAGLGEFVRSAMRLSLYDPIERLLHHALPSGIEGWSKRFVDSYIEPSGHIAGAVILALVVLANNSFLYFLVSLGVAIALFYSAQRMGLFYRQSLSQSLQAGEYRFMRHAAGEWGPSDTAQIHRVLEQITELPYDSREALMLSEVIAESHIPEGYQMLSARFHECPNHIKAEMLPIIINGYRDTNHSAENIQLIYDMLASESSDVRRAALRLIATYPDLDPNYKVAELLVEIDPEVNIVSASVLLKHPVRQIQQAARSQLRWLAKHEKANVRLLAVRTLVQGSINQFGEVIEQIDLYPYLTDPATRVREAALGAATFSQLVRAACDPSRNVRTVAIRYLRDKRFAGSTKYIRQALHEINRIEQMTNYMQIDSVICFWWLLIALSRVNRRAGANYMQVALHEGFGKLDLIDSITLTLQELDDETLSPIIAQMQLDYDTLLQSMLEYIEAIYDEGRVKALFWTLAKSEDEDEKQKARRALQHMTSPAYAEQFEQALITVAGENERIENGLPQAVIDALLNQIDDWRPVITLYSILNLPPEKRRWLNDEDITDIIGYRMQSDIPAIREAVRLIQNRHERKEAFTHIAEDQDTLASEVVMLSTLERMIFLRNVSFFGNLRLDQLRALARVCGEVSMAEGKTIIKQGDAGDGLYIVVEGSVRVERKVPNSKDPLYLFSLGTSEVFGEISLLDGGVRTANIVAETPVFLLSIKRDALDDALEDDPSIAMGMLRAMAEKVRRSTETIDKHVPGLDEETIRDFQQRP